MIEKIISGGQTGVDRAALDVALGRGMDCGGWCPKGRRAEDGVIPDQYPLQETTSKSYPVRTAKNVLEADATLILTRGKADRGTALTIRLAEENEKPFWQIDLEDNPDAAQLRAAIITAGVRVLNVAGPRESSTSGIYKQAVWFLAELLDGEKDT